ncbi:MAG: hypothetical protein CBE01_005870 [Planctomycetaceae bacterium TMED241]|nr:MAG: hypothetical protein CBE01_005870 [Planctomycetaceae bacterium TMED241]
MQFIKATIVAAALGTCCLGNAMPAIAAMSPEKIEQSNTILRQALNAAQSADWETACKRYKEYAEFKKLHNGFDYDTVIGKSGRIRELTTELNKKIRESNGNLNQSGSFLCGEAGMAWTNYVMPAAPASAFGSVNHVNSTSSVAGNIRARCEREWGTDYEMVRYCIDNQTEAARSLGY